MEAEWRPVQLTGNTAVRTVWIRGWGTPPDKDHRVSERRVLRAAGESDLRVARSDSPQGLTPGQQTQVRFSPSCGDGYLQSGDQPYL